MTRARPLPPILTDPPLLVDKLCLRCGAPFVAHVWRRAGRIVFDPVLCADCDRATRCREVRGRAAGKP